MQMPQRKAVLELAEQADMSLMDVTDLYNGHFGTSYSTRILRRLDDEEGGMLIRLMAERIEEQRERNRRRR